jgi:hypothetical protein
MQAIIVSKLYSMQSRLPITIGAHWQAATARIAVGRPPGEPSTYAQVAICMGQALVEVPLAIKII